MQLAFYTLDVFTDVRFHGNPVAVVLDADGLDTQRMQAIAREFNLSETVFIQKPERPAHSARMRIFTPATEIPFAGHPTVGTAALLAELRAPDFEGVHESIVVLEQTIGTVRVGVKLRQGKAAFAEFDAPRLPADEGALASPERLASALGLIPNEIGFENHRAMRFSAGNAFAFVPVATIEAIRRARPNPEHWTPAFAGQGFIGAFLYTRQCVHTTSAFHARMFAPDYGVAEDPATGSAAVGLAGIVNKYDKLPDGLHKRIVEQGYEMDRPSHITLTLDVANGRLKAVRIGGQCVRVSEGRLSV